MVYIVWSEPSLHEPMYIFICNLMWNDMFGSSASLLKLAIDLLSGCSTISFFACMFDPSLLRSELCWLTLCGNSINNVYCETMSLTRLSCVSTLVNDAYGSFLSLLVHGGSLIIVIFCYIQTFFIFLKISMEASQKAIHTLVTHIITFLTFMVTVLFVSFRYRLSRGSLSVVTHLVISIGGPTASMALNHLIFGIRTHALKTKMISNLKKILQK
ncbi:olfactory receptor 52B6-like [Anomaloglossus baeobatrachus]|uniref:olfactory receptor 52B6-like n=1 Tax=Anomaloglossus baeobatrachus TaxID=238106 RepID=UPI003F5061FE